MVVRWLPSVDGTGGWLLLLLASLCVVVWHVSCADRGLACGLASAVVACGLAFAAVRFGWWRCWGCPWPSSACVSSACVAVVVLLFVSSRLALALARGLAVGLRACCTRTFACVRLLLRCVPGCCALGCGTGLLPAACGLVVCVMVRVVRAQAPPGLWCHHPPALA